MTVEQTLKFAIACRTPNIRLNNVSREEYQNYVLEILTTVFGLRHTVKTKVGNDYVRGVSGGERKRVSISEALASRASVYCWDNATRGLDASTALEYSHAIRAATNFLGNVGYVAIYQAGENIYEVFDKVTVMYNGRQVFFGPVERAKAYFEEMGWYCPPRQSTPEFLTAVTDPNGRIPRKDFNGRLPKNADEFEQYWHNSSDFKLLLSQIEKYEAENDREATIERFQVAHNAEKMKRQRPHSRYMLTYPAQLRIAVKRGWDRVVGDMTYTIVNTTGSIIQSLIIGSLFYNISNTTSGAFSRGGVLFFSILYNALTSLAEINNAFAQRPILMKQKSYSFYHMSVEALQHNISQIPIRLLTYTVFGLIVYFLANLNRTAGQFFFYLLIMSFTAFALGSFFSMISSFTKQASAANAIAGIGMLILSIYTGYMIPLPVMHKWFWWVSFLNPLRFAFESLMANEFHGREMECDLLVPSGPGYENITIANQVCAFSGSIPGQATVLGDNYINQSFTYTWSHAWRNFGLLIVFWVGFAGIDALAAEFLNPVAGGGDVLLFKRGHLPSSLDDAEEKVASKQDLADAFAGLTEGEPDVFSWQNVNYTVPVKGGTRQLLNNIQGYVKPGTMTALMGESGAGKTTLLNVLSQRITVGVITGDMLVNGRPLDDSFKRSTGYVQQQDLHLHTSTVRESLQFAARLRQPAHVPDAEKLDYVEKIISLLGMTNYAEAYVGTMGRGLNVEQRKKLSIGVELVAKPSLLLFLDEPTSGLDSQSAWAISTFMKSLATAGQSILCTIHQPSATLFETFDRLLLLKKGGRTVYFGDLGESSHTLISYFERNGARKCAASENPAEYILESIGAGATASVKTDWGDIWDNSPECAATTREINLLHEQLRKRPVKEATKHLTARFAAGYWTQLKYVYQRTSIQYWRSPEYIMAKFVLMLIGGLFIGFTFWDSQSSIAGLQNGMFGVFLSIIISSPLSNQIETFAEASRDLYEAREAASNTFHWANLILSQFLCEIPYHIVFSTLYFIAFYFPVQYSTDAEIAGYFYLIYCVVFQIFYVSFSLAIMYFSPDAASAAVITAMLFSFMISFCGVMQPVSQMPGFWTFMYKVSPHTYIVQSLLGVTLHDVPVVCTDEELNTFQPPSGLTCQEFAGKFVDTVGGYLDSRTADATSNCRYCRYSVGDQYLETIGVKYSYRWRNLGFLFAYCLFNIFAMVFLYYLFRARKQEGKSSNFFAGLMAKFSKPPKPTSEDPVPEDIYKLQPGDDIVANEIENRTRAYSVSRQNTAPNEAPLVIEKN